MNLDIDAACGVLQKLQEEIGSPPSTEPLRTVAIALQFIWGSGHLHNFEDYLACFKPSDSLPSPSSFETREQAEASLQQPMEPRHAHSIPRPPLCSFGTRKEADTWLNAHPRPPHGARVEIAGQRYSVGHARDSGLRVLVRRPPLEEPELTEQGE